MNPPQRPPEVHIGERVLGAGYPVYVIAEISANHHQHYDKALALIEAAAAAGADAVKMQTYTPESMTLDSDAPPFRIKGTPWEGRRLFDLYQEAMTPWEWQSELKVAAEDLGMQCFSTPFDEAAINFLVGLRVPALKIASFELIDFELAKKIAMTNLPVLMSTGMASIAEIEAAVATVRSAGTEELLLFRCNSAYPASPSEMDLLTIPHMATTWGVPVGLSDHTLGVTAAVAAVALGACHDRETPDPHPRRARTGLRLLARTRGVRDLGPLGARGRGGIGPNPLRPVYQRDTESGVSPLSVCCGQCGERRGIYS